MKPTLKNLLLFSAPKPLRIAKTMPPILYFTLLRRNLLKTFTRKNYGNNTIFSGFYDFSDEIFPHFVWEKNLTGIIRKIRSASPKSPSDFPNVSQIFWCGLPHQKTSDNSDVKYNKISIS